MSNYQSVAAVMVGSRDVGGGDRPDPTGEPCDVPEALGPPPLPGRRSAIAHHGNPEISEPDVPDDAGTDNRPRRGGAAGVSYSSSPTSDGDPAWATASTGGGVDGAGGVPGTTLMIRWRRTPSMIPRSCERPSSRVGGAVNWRR
jgi:hypothetical protein